MTESTVKACKLCSTNLSGQKRVKSTSGEYYCPPCWKSYSSIFGEEPANAGKAAAPAVMETPPPVRAQSAPPTVQIVRSEPQKTIAQAALEGAKEGAFNAAFKIVSRALFFAQFLLSIALAKKLFPNANDGAMVIVGLTSGIAALIEIDLLARAMDLHYRWLDAETLKSRVGIIGMIGVALAFALAIFLAVTGR